MIYVLSDIHGQMRRFKSILRQIELQPEDTLYVLGDVIDRNPDGIRILRRLMAMPNVKMLRGNHEHMMLDALYYPHDRSGPDGEYRWAQRMNRWYRNGGEVTHRYLKHIRKALRQEIFEYLDSLPLSMAVTVGGRSFLLCHAAPEGLFGQYRSFTPHTSETEFALWYRFNEFDCHPCEETVIFGHSLTDHYQQGEPLSIWQGPGLICIDCGSSTPEWTHPDSTRKGRLACLRLDDMREFYSEEPPC